MLRSLFCLAIPFFLGSAIASAQVVLESKFPEGTKFVVNTDEKTTEILTLGGMDFDIKASSFAAATMSIGTRGQNGVLKCEQKLDSLQVEASIPGGLTLRFDSIDPRKNADVPELESTLESCRARCSPVTIEIDSKNKIISASLPAGEYEKLPPSAKEEFKLESLKKTVERAYAFLPDEPVKKGDTWERSIEIQLGDGQSMIFRIKYEYAGTIEKDGKTLDKIIGKALEINYSSKPTPTYQITKSELKVIDSEETHLFDRERGALVSSKSKVRIAGPITMVVNGDALEGKMDLTMEETAIRQP